MEKIRVLWQEIIFVLKKLVNEKVNFAKFSFNRLKVKNTGQK